MLRGVKVSCSPLKTLVSNQRSLVGLSTFGLPVATRLWLKKTGRPE